MDDSILRHFHLKDRPILEARMKLPSNVAVLGRRGARSSEASNVAVLVRHGFRSSEVS